MKHVKHMLVAVLTVFLAAVLAVPAFAADTHTISVQDSDTHTYKVYQVLTGTLSEEGSKQLGNPTWGSDANAVNGKVNDQTAQQFVDSLKGLDDQTLAETVKGVLKSDATGVGTVKKGAPLSNLPTGYYILVDETTPLTHDGKVDTKALHVIQVLNDIQGIEIKWGTTESDKEIVSDTLGTATEANPNPINGDVDNVSIGDTVNFKIEATIPANASLYNYFYFVVNDTLDPGLTLTSSSIKVYEKGATTDTELASTAYAVKTGNDASPKTFQVGLNDAKSLAGKTIIVKYSAVLNENATIGEVPNKNTSTVTFSNDPNHVYDGKNSPAFPDTTDSQVTGETPVTETKTYTTGIEIQKVDENGNVLTGATFKISGDSAKKVLTVAETFTPSEEGNYYKLKNGTYTTVPPTEDAMEKAAAGATKGYVIDNTYTGEGAITIGETTYRPYAPATDSEKDIYVLKQGSSSLYESTTTKYAKTTSKTTVDATTSHAAEKAVDANGLVRFDGLGEGTYKINETVTPAGYNTLPELTVTVSFNAQGEKVWSFSGGNGAYDAGEGIYKITIENNKGTELPSTGGMGTTILYTVGGIMVIAGIVMFLTKRRMASIEK